MICAISGEVPEDQVLSKKSGLLFERRFIERYIEDHAMCPVTKEELTMDDLVPVKSNKPTRLPSPGLCRLQAFPDSLGCFRMSGMLLCCLILLWSSSYIQQDKNLAMHYTSMMLHAVLSPD